MEVLNLTPQAAIMGAIGILLLFGMAFGKGMVAEADGKQTFNKLVDHNLTRLITIENQIREMEIKVSNVEDINRKLTNQNKALDLELNATRRELTISQGRVTELESKVKVLENENAELKAQIEALRAQMAGHA